ncbi:MAG: hypothetical protein R6V06_07520 [Kiritimatiellia bacterium]
MKYFIFIISLLFTANSLVADRMVFDMPEVHERHLGLLKLMDSAHSRKNYHAMAEICRKGLDLQTSDSLWTYNLACAMSLQGKKNEAIKKLKEAFILGFHDLEYMKTDKDLQNLHNTGKFSKLIDELNETSVSESFTNTAGPPVKALPPGSDNTVIQTATNTIWSFGTGLFQSFISISPRNATNTATAGDTPYLLYVNRDNNSGNIDFSEQPGVLKLKYCDEMKERKLHIGVPNSLFGENLCGHLIPVVGNSSMGFINSPYWRSQPRALFNDPNAFKNQIVLFFGNQLYCYPAYSDYQIETGDLFPANTPYYVAVSGKAKTEHGYVKAIARAIGALAPETRDYLTANGLIMPTIQQMLRNSQKTVTGHRTYMSGIAHPAVFQPDQLDIDRLMHLAGNLTTNNLPPMLAINVEDKSGLVPELDMATCVYSENLFDTHLAVAKVFRGFPYRRKYEVEVHCDNPEASIRCVLLQGTARKFSVKQSAEDPDKWIVELAYHQPFRTEIAGGRSIMTSRVDIGFFAETGQAVSLPAVLSIYSAGNEQRIYDEDEHLVSIDYRRGTIPYTDPLIFYSRNWKDEFIHDDEGRIIGWNRIRPRKKERFTAYGDLAIEFDNKGRAIKARRITYTKRYMGSLGRQAGQIPSLAQVDDNIEVTYTYASDEDYIGRPDKELTRRLTPPTDN